MYDIMKRFMSKVSKQPNGCWVWTGCLNKQDASKGYGYFRVGGRLGRSVLAHVFAYQQLVGKIPVGLELDHACRNRKCVNPEHLEPVTGKVNTLRGEGPTAVNARKTHCVNGHALTPENVSIDRGRRRCKACGRDRAKKYYHRKAAI